MKRNSIIYYAAILLTTVIASCTKVVSKFNSNNINVTFNNAGPLYLTTDKTVNGKDSIQFSYSVTSTQPMTYVVFKKDGNEISRDSVKTGDQLSLPIVVKKLVADTVNGVHTYQVVAYNNDAIYLGASTAINVTTMADMAYHTNLRLYVPDSISKTNPCFINLVSGTTYSYTDVTNGASSAQVDLGYFFSTDTVNIGTATAPNKVPVGHSFYAPNSIVTGEQRPAYDLSTWTRNATLINVATTPTFASLTSAGAIKSAGLLNLKTVNGSVPLYTATTAPQSSFKALAAGSVIFFKTVGGKYGAIQVDYLSQSNANHTNYVNFEYKIQL